MKEDLSLSKLRNYILLLVAIFVFSFILRIVGIDRVPTGVSPDDLTLFSNAKSIAQTGRDIFGNLLPLFPSYKGFLVSPVVVYVIALFYKIFGFSFVVGYLPNIIISSISVVVTALLATKLTGKRYIGIIAALFIAVSPWHYHLSRTGFEGVFGFCLALFAVYFSVLAIKNPKYYIASIVLFALSAFSYKAVSIFLFLYPILFFLTLGWKKVKLKHALIFTLGIWIIVALQFYFLFVNSRDTYSSGYISNNVTKATVVAQNEKVMSDAPRVVRLIVSNKLTSLARIYFENYIHFFSPQYLLTQGDKDLRYSTGQGGQLYMLDILFIVLGIMWLAKTRKNKELLFLLSIILFAPLASLISDQEYAVRTFISVFAFAILSACGVQKLIEWSRSVRIRKYLVIGLGLFYIIFVSIYLYRYHFLYVHYGREFWGGVNQEVFTDAYKMRAHYANIVFGDSAESEYLGFMYWNKLPSKDIQKALASYDNKKLTYKNFSFVRTCGTQENEILPQSIKSNEILYTREPCIKDIQPLIKYYLPKLLIWNWKTYDAKTVDAFYSKINN